jgi:hypothetical protein
MAQGAHVVKVRDVFLILSYCYQFVMAEQSQDNQILKSVKSDANVPSKVSAKKCSVADPGCLSRILIFTHSGSRIQKQHQKRGVQKN